MTEDERRLLGASVRHPVNERHGTALMLPGRAYSCEMSLLACTTRALRSTGWTVLHAVWDLPVLPQEPRAFVEAAARELDAMERGAGPVLVVAKSLGTLAAHWGAGRGYPAVWLTPVLRAGGQHPLPDESKALVQRLRHYPSDNLVVGGTADPLWRPGFRGTGTVLEVEGADHGLEVADPRRTLQHHEDIASAVADFAAGLR